MTFDLHHSPIVHKEAYESGVPPAGSLVQGRQATLSTDSPQAGGVGQDKALYLRHGLPGVTQDVKDLCLVQVLRGGGVDHGGRGG